MLYCKDCHMVCDGPACPVCGGRKLRAPEADDFCYLAEKQRVWTPAVEDGLKNRDIPYAFKPVMGAAIALYVSPMLECYSFFVPYSRLAEAKAVMEELFGCDADEDDNNN